MTSLSAKGPWVDRLRELNPYVQLLDPSCSQNSDPLHPLVILLFGWLLVGLPYLQKYVDTLHKLFPTSTIVLIRAYTAWYFTPNRWLEEGILPAINIIKREMSSEVKFRGVLVHVLSNGGALQLNSVRDVLARSDLRARDNCRQGPPTALVLDSSPAQHELSSAIQSWALNHPILHYFAIPPIATVYAGFYIANRLAGHQPIFKALRDSLNSPNLLPLITDPHDAKATPRVYMYSDGDCVTTSNDVETHYASAVSKGFDATLERFVDSQYITHMRADPERYWRAVTSIWMKALQRSGSRPVLSSL